MVHFDRGAAVSDIDDLIQRVQKLRQRAVLLRQRILEIDPPATHDEHGRQERRLAAIEALKAQQQAAACLARDAWKAKSVRLRKFASASGEAVEAMHLAKHFVGASGPAASRRRRLLA